MSSAFDPRRIFHWGYVVSDMDRALETWREQGSRMLVPPTVDPIQNVRCCLLIYRSSVPIELVAPMPEGPSPLSSRLRRGGGLDHVCLFTDDLEAELPPFAMKERWSCRRPMARCLTGRWPSSPRVAGCWWS